MDAQEKLEEQKRRDEERAREASKYCKKKILYITYN